MIKENILLVHGLLGSLEYFGPKKYLPDFNILCPDLYGYNKADYKENLTLQDQVDFAKQYLLNHYDVPSWILGHSVGGAVAMMFASQNPYLTKGIINVEGNFSLKDAFWCEKIADMDYDRWEEEYAELSRSPQQWLLDSGIQISENNIMWAKEILNYQSAKTVYAVANAVVRDTASKEYLDTVENVTRLSIPHHLVAGEYSYPGWDVPENIKKSVVDVHILEGCGHMMMLEQPEKFCSLVSAIIKS